MSLIRYLIKQANTRMRQGGTAAGISYGIRFTLLTVAYFIVARSTIHFFVLHDSIAALWPAAALAFCGCLIWGKLITPAIWLGATLTSLTSGTPTLPAVLVGLDSALEAYIAVYLIQRIYRMRIQFVYEGSTLPFIGIAFLASIVGASLGVAGLSVTERYDAGSLTFIWLTWWLRDAASMVIGVPMLLAWQIGRNIQWSMPKIIEASVFTLLLPTMTQLIFSSAFGNGPVAYMAILLVLWAAFRFNLPVVAWAIGTICVIAIWNTIQGTGPFASDDRNTSLLLLMAYMCAIGAMGISLANALCQQRDIQAILRTERDRLEQKVIERTSALRADIERRKHIEQQLALREKQLSDAQRLAQLGSWNWDLDNRTITWSDELYRIYGISRDRFPLSVDRFRTLIHPDDFDKFKQTIRECIITGKPFHIAYRIVQPESAVKTVSALGQASCNTDGRITHLFGTVQDITETTKAQAALREAEQRYRMVVERSPEAILVLQNDRIVLANPAAATLLHVDSAQQLTGKSVFDYLEEDCRVHMQERIAHLQDSCTLPLSEEKLRRQDGGLVDIEMTISPFLHEGKFASLLIFRDITERKKNLEQIAYLAHYDSLTGLPNRTLFHQRLQHALSIAERPGRSLEILFLDLDRFKQINDTLGHAAGDMVLKETAMRLQGTLRESDTVARLGGDEFVVLVENIDEPHRGGIIAEKILAAFVPPFICKGQPLSISTSIGISTFPNDGTDADTLLKKADLAMYQAKQRGRNSYRYFSPEMNLRADELHLIEQALTYAITRNELSLHYQPKIEILTNRIIGMEALLRWHHPIMGEIPPHRFIPIAEESGLIRSIGYWAIRSACRQNKHWQENNSMRLKVAVNLSSRQLWDDRLIDNIRAILNETKLDARYLELEITERAAMADSDNAVRVLNTLHGLGVSIAIDNFGSGYSSLAYLKQFPIQTVKIDRSFVQGAPLNQRDSAATKAIINLAHSLECSAIADGAETQQQFDFLRDHACDSVQGFYFSGPMSADHFEDLIRVQSKLHVH